MDLQKLYRDGYYYWVKSYPYFEFDINQSRWNHWQPPPCPREIKECFEDVENVKVQDVEAVARRKGYTLIYFIRPRLGARFSELIWKTLFLEFHQHPRIVATSVEKRAQRLAVMAREMMGKAEFQRKQGWRWVKKFRVY